MIPTYFNNKEDENREVEYNALDGKKRKFMGSTGLGMGIGAVYELVKLRKKILARWQKQCEKAIARGEPCPPRPDTSRGALMAILRGSVKGAVFTFTLAPSILKEALSTPFVSSASKA